MLSDKKCKDPRIEFAGSKQEVDEAIKLVESILPLPGEPKRNSYSREPECRLILQKLIDKHKIKAHILFEGNSVFSYDRVIRDFKRFIEDPNDKDAWVPLGSMLRLPVYGGAQGKCPISDHLYDFFTDRCGTIAHYDKHGWHATYPDLPALAELFKKNEYGHRVVDDQDRFSDSKRIVDEMQRLLDTATAPNAVAGVDLTSALAYAK